MSGAPKIDYYRKSFNCSASELNLIEQYDDDIVRNYKFNDITFACVIEGSKEFSVDNKHFFDLDPGTIIITDGDDTFYSKTKSKDQKTTCFTLEVSRFKVKSLVQEVLNFNNTNKEGIKLNTELSFHSYKQSEQVNLTQSLISIFNAHSSDFVYKDKLVSSYLDSLLLNSFQLNWWEQLKNESLMNSNSLSYIIDYILNNLNKPLFIDDLSNKACMSRATFFRRFKTIFGKTPIEFILDERLKKSKLLVDSSEKPISQISKEVGFFSESYFIKAFKYKYHTTPLNMRKNLINSGQTH